MPCLSLVHQLHHRQLHFEARPCSPWCSGNWSSLLLLLIMVLSSMALVVFQHRPVIAMLLGNATPLKRPLPKALPSSAIHRPLSAFTVPQVTGISHSLRPWVPFPADDSHWATQTSYATPVLVVLLGLAAATAAMFLQQLHPQRLLPRSWGQRPASEWWILSFGNVPDNVKESPTQPHPLPFRDHSPPLDKPHASPIEKPVSDHRKYDYVKFPNGLKVLLISDHLCDSAAVAMTLDVGSLDDPWDRQGLTHFLEHMLFLGTEKYPNEDEFEDYVNAHGGSCNASTGLDHTCFHFTVSPTALEGALDRFAQFFVHPLFSPAAVGREVRAIDSEYKDGLLDDDLRLYQMIRSQAHPDHSFGKFAGGSISTLLTNPGQSSDTAAEVQLCTALWDFFEKYYVPHRMSLCVIGRESLMELDDIVRRTFSPLLNKGAVTSSQPVVHSSNVYEAPPTRNWSSEGPPLKPEVLGQLLYYNPVMSLQRITFYWPVPVVDLVNPYAMPYDILGHLLDVQSKGSLGGMLSQLGWLEDSDCGIETSMRDYEIFTLQLDLTEDGQHHKEDIIAFVFRYFAMLQQSPTNELLKVYHTLQTLWQLEFLYWQESEPQWTVESLSQNLFFYPPIKVLSGDYQLQWDEPLVREYLSYFHVDNSIVAVGAKEDFNMAEGTEVHEEQWYSTTYKMKPLASTSILSKVKRQSPLSSPLLEGACSDMKLPDINAYLPSDFRLKSELPPRYTLLCQGQAVAEGADEREKVLRSAPLLLDGRRMHRLWYKLDGSYRQPRVCVAMHVAQPDPKVAAPVEQQLQLHAFLQLLEDVMVEELQQAEDAGLFMDSSVENVSISLNFWGFSHHLPYYVERILTTTQALISFVLQPSDSPPLVTSTASHEAQSETPGAATGPFQLPDMAELEIKFRTVCYRMRREHEDALQGAPVDLLGLYVWYLLGSHAFHPEEVLRALQQPTWLSLQQCAAAMQSLLSNAQLEVFLHGNVDALEASSFRSRAAAIICPHLLPSMNDNGSPPKEVEWDAGFVQFAKARQVPLSGAVMDVVSPNEDEKNCAVEYYMQTGPTLDWNATPPLDRMPSVTLDFIEHVASTSAFATLRTDNQLGYVVQANARVAGNSQGLSITVQSPTASPAVIVARIEDWLRNLLDPKLMTMTQEEFDTQAAALRSIKSERHPRLASEAEQHWGLMAGATYDFDAPAKDLSALSLLTLADVQKMWTRCLHPDAPERRLLIARAWGPEGWATYQRGKGRKRSTKAFKATSGVLQNTDLVNEYRLSWPLYPMMVRRKTVPVVTVVPTINHKTVP